MKAMLRFRRMGGGSRISPTRRAAAIYGIEEAEGTRALVLELVEGPTLAESLGHVVAATSCMLVAIPIDGGTRETAHDIAGT